VGERDKAVNIGRGNVVRRPSSAVAPLHELTYIQVKKKR
jgi:hypothetical protein